MRTDIGVAVDIEGDGLVKDRCMLTAIFSSIDTYAHTFLSNSQREHYKVGRADFFSTHFSYRLHLLRGDRLRVSARLVDLFLHCIGF